MMKNLKRQFKNEFDQLDFSEEISTNIKSNIISKYKKRKRNKRIMFSIFAVLFITIAGFGISYADEIKETFDILIATREKRKSKQGTDFELYEIKGKAIKKLNYYSQIELPECNSVIDPYEGVPDDDKCLKNYSYSELEKELKIKILKSDLFVNNKLILYKLDRVDGRISSIYFKMKNVLGNKKADEPYIPYPQIHIDISIATKYNEYYKENDEPAKFWSWYAYSEDEIHEYYIKKLGTTAKGINLGRYGRVVVLIHDGIVYRFMMHGLGNKMKDKTPDVIMQEILDSLYY